MAIITRYLEFATQGGCECRNLTEDITSILSETKLACGTATLFVPGATGAITTVEFEPGLLQDLQTMWEHLIPSSSIYQHNRAWGDGNGHSHLRAALIGPSLTIPVVEHQLTLGTWQQVVFLDFDTHPRTRRLVLQFMGEI